MAVFVCFSALTAKVPLVSGYQPKHIRRRMMGARWLTLARRSPLLLCFFESAVEANADRQKFFELEMLANFNNHDFHP